jgi:hypothetical protein
MFGTSIHRASTPSQDFEDGWSFIIKIDAVGVFPETPIFPTRDANCILFECGQNVMPTSVSDGTYGSPFEASAGHISFDRPRFFGQITKNCEKAS